MTAQIVLITIVFAQLLLAANQHGKERPKANFWVQLLSELLFLSILYWGGFFDVIINKF